MEIERCGNISWAEMGISSNIIIRLRINQLISSLYISYNSCLHVTLVLDHFNLSSLPNLNLLSKVQGSNSNFEQLGVGFLEL